MAPARAAAIGIDEYWAVAGLSAMTMAPACFIATVPAAAVMSGSG